MSSHSSTAAAVGEYVLPSTNVCKFNETYRGALMTLGFQIILWGFFVWALVIEFSKPGTQLVFLQKYNFPLTI